MDDMFWISANHIDMDNTSVLKFEADDATMSVHIWI